MARNNIRQLRTKLKLTQQQLAKAVDTSQQQIQRIEASVQSVRVDLAIRICKALKAEMRDVFPGTELPIARAAKRKSPINLYENEELASDLSKEDFDTDPLKWQVMYQLRGGVSGTLPISGPDKRRLQSIMERARDELSLLQFVVFDSGNRRIAINLDHLIVCRFVFEMPNAEIPEPKDLNKLDIVFHLISETKPLRVSITPDHESLDRNPDYDGEAPLQDLFDSIQKLPSQYVSFYDEDDEEVFIKSADISMISASLSVLGNLDEL